MAKFQLNPDEKEIDHWTIYYKPPFGGRYNGKLIVTNKRLIYDAKIDISSIGASIADTYHFGSYGMLIIPKEDIKSVEPEKSFLSKRINITTTENILHVFDYGVLNIDKIVEAINKK